MAKTIEKKARPTVATFEEFLLEYYGTDEGKDQKKKKTDKDYLIGIQLAEKVLNPQTAETSFSGQSE